MLSNRTLCRTLDKTITNLELELAAARVAQESILNGAPLAETLKATETTAPRKYLMVIGINTAFSSHRRRDSVRATWMPQGSTSTFIFFLLHDNLLHLIIKFFLC